MNMRNLLPASAPYKDLPPRALIDRRNALNELLRRAWQVELKAVVYAYKTEKIIVCATTGICEVGSPEVIFGDASDEALGVSVYGALLNCHTREQPNMRDAKLVNWAAYQASGAKTGRAFETSSTYVTIQTAGSAILIEGSRRLPRSETYVGRSNSITGAPDILGTSIRNVIDTVRLLDAQDALD